jgi:hypothetical protein
LVCEIVEGCLTICALGDMEYRGKAIRKSQ